MCITVLGLRFAHNGITWLYKDLAMIMQEKIKVVKKQIPNSSNSFLFRKSYIHSKIPTDYPQNPWRFITVPIPIPYPYPWESPWESPYPRQPCQIVRQAEIWRESNWPCLPCHDATVRIPPCICGDCPVWLCATVLLLPSSQWALSQSRSFLLSWFSAASTKFISTNRPVYNPSSALLL